MWTYQMKKLLLMQKALFELKCSILMSFFVCNGNTRMVFGGAISPELLVGLFVPFPTVLSTGTK